jgi:hypothetical protein
MLISGLYRKSFVRRRASPSTIPWPNRHTSQPIKRAIDKVCADRLKRCPLIDQGSMAANKFRVPLPGLLYAALLGEIVDMDEAQPLTKTFSPFEVVR